MPADFYQRVADICRERGALLILDASGAGLRHISSGVFLLKPSVRELRECVGRELISESEQLAAARELIARGCAQFVVVSLGSEGALLATPGGGQRYSPVRVPSGSGVGAGDAMTAGITVGLSRGWQLDKAVRLGIAAGGNINPEGTSMFEPMGGSAPKYTGQNVINPLAAINAAGMMLDFLGEAKAGAAIEEAVVKIINTKIKSLAAGKMGHGTCEVGDLVAAAV